MRLSCKAGRRARACGIQDRREARSGGQGLHSRRSRHNKQARLVAATGCCMCRQGRFLCCNCAGVRAFGHPLQQTGFRGLQRTCRSQTTLNKGCRRPWAGRACAPSRCGGAGGHAAPACRTLNTVSARLLQAAANVDAAGLAPPPAVAGLCAELFTLGTSARCKLVPLATIDVTITMLYPS